MLVLKNYLVKAVYVRSLCYLVVEIVAFARRSRRTSHALALIALLVLH